jgi:hypothetical protein
MPLRPSTQSIPPRALSHLPYVRQRPPARQVRAKESKDTQQVKAADTERALRDLFNDLQARGETDLATGVYMAARKLGLVTAAWRPSRAVIKARLRAATPASPA